MPSKSRPLRCLSNSLSFDYQTQSTNALNKPHKVTGTPSKTESTFSMATKKQVQRPSIFRERPAAGDFNNEMFTLKRANPVYDSDDEGMEFHVEMPNERTDTTQIFEDRDDNSSTDIRTQQILAWQAQISETDEKGFVISLR
mmetsp:Transcript_16827/g.24362  ORF Transcript_16827/g.24362 Transcript_16827/m.24362 type:complete len:142 (-) Transcript_16827:158-583(-)|eukprot:CAMPEP_0202452002 /NCGR_PEP_ID=MMETSP1360-20130828/10291_1 /ASSEMBLY_ACC=CAM_ASM_000848 /TAXON_ID=515479 /ORGANISM="Licmophora paradoxa, Strain CCMP2313" /LENGTH=141 /DNA_ID=CAMNT_0049070697 /DNA_START=257 /DNA_END=682 /DNA_ORIENTATION=-